MILECPKCGGRHISSERRVDGYKKCLACGYKAVHKEWDLCKTAHQSTQEARIAELEDALEKIASNIFVVTRPCEAHDLGIEDAECNCFDYSMSVEMDRMYKQAVKALGKDRWRDR